MSSKVEILHHATRQHSALNSLLVLESALSFPVPHLVGEKIYLRFLIYDKDRDKNDAAGQIAIYRPYARVSVDFNTGALVEYVALNFENDQPQTCRGEKIGHAVECKKSRSGFEEIKSQRALLFSSTQHILHLIGRNDLTAEEVQTMNSFREAFNKVAEPCLLPYYRSLNPALFEWLDYLSSSYEAQLTEAESL